MAPATKFGLQEKSRILDTIAKLEELGGKAFTEDDILHEGNKLIIPVGMGLAEAEKAIRRKREELEEVVQFSRTFPYRPWDGAFSAYNAMRRAFGMVSHSGTMFEAPKLITIDVDVNEQAQIPWGKFTIPFLPDCAFTFGGTEDEQHGAVFVVHAQGPKKRSAAIEGIFVLIANELATNSLYRGKAIDGKEQPGFIDVHAVDPRQVVYSEEVLRQLNANVWAFIERPDVMRANGIPLKRAILLHGPFGTGKSLTALLTAQKARANGVTFLWARPGEDDFHQVMQTARLYQPAVVFYEDVDTISDPDNLERDEISKLLDTFDGIQAKDAEIIVILTSNNPEKIHKGMVRPGRLDAVVEIAYLDRVGVENLIRVTIPEDTISPDVDWDRVHAHVPEFTPAFITGVAKAAFLYALAELNVPADANDATINDAVSSILLTTENFCDAADSYQAQLNLMNGAKEEGKRPDLEVAMRQVVRSAAVNSAEEAIEDLVHPDLLVEEPRKR